MQILSQCLYIRLCTADLPGWGILTPKTGDRTMLALHAWLNWGAGERSRSIGALDRWGVGGVSLAQKMQVMQRVYE